MPFTKENQIRQATLKNDYSPTRLNSYNKRKENFERDHEKEQTESLSLEVDSTPIFDTEGVSFQDENQAREHSHIPTPELDKIESDYQRQKEKIEADYQRQMNKIYAFERLLLPAMLIIIVVVIVSF